MKTLRLSRMSPNMTFQTIKERIAESFLKDNIFPDVIEMDIDDYLEFSLMLVNPNIGSVKDGYIFHGIKIKLYSDI